MHMQRAILFSALDQLLYLRLWNPLALPIALDFSSCSGGSVRCAIRQRYLQWGDFTTIFFFFFRFFFFSKTAIVHAFALAATNSKVKLSDLEVGGEDKCRTETETNGVRQSGRETNIEKLKMKRQRRRV